MAEKVTLIESSEETVDLTCNVRGYPTPKVTWTPAEQVQQIVPGSDRAAVNS